MPLVFWLLWIAAAGLTAVFTNSAFFLVLWITGIAVPPLSALLSAIAGRFVSLEFSGPEAFSKARNIKLTLTVRNRCVIPIIRARADITAENLLTGGVQSARVSFAAGPKAARRLPLELHSEHCGVIRVSVTRIFLCDCLGIFPLRRKVSVTHSVSVVPDTFSPHINIPMKMSGAEDADRYSLLKPGLDYSEPFQIREYREGDSPKQIHWKLSAKHDKLIVRDPSLPLDRSVLIFWERFSAPPGETPAQSDAMAEIAVSLCRALNRRGIRCRIVWNDTRDSACRTAEISCEDELYEILPELLAARAGGTGEGCLEPYLRLYGRVSYGKAVYLSSSIRPLLERVCPPENLTVLLCGSEEAWDGHMYRFNANNYEETLFELNLH